MQSSGKATAEEIRRFVNVKYIEPARRAGWKQIRIRAGDIHDEMALKSRMPAVCGAIGSNKLQGDCRLRLVKREGPTHGANVYFTFEFLP